MSIKGINVNGTEHKIDYNSLENLPDLSIYQRELDYDSEPTLGSDNMLTSGDIYNALQNYTPGGSNTGEVTDYVENGNHLPLSSYGAYIEFQNVYGDIESLGTNLNNSIESLGTDLNTKVDKEDGKALSTNDFTDNLKDNLVKLINRQSDGVLPHPTAALDLCIPIIKDGRWVYQTIDNIIPNAESGEF